MTASEEMTLVDQLLAEQRNLTAVDRFARAHRQHDAPLMEKEYRDLIPLTKPASGEQYAFHVNLDKCSGCKSCVSACHSLNGLDDGEMWRNVGLLIGDRKPAGTRANACESIPYLQTITTACHHCAEPACASGCPVLAYDKDPVTGIVRHLDDQCIGCQYCVLKCPYDVPKYSARKGIVRKCDMCHGRLEAGEAPACVQACPSKAISIEIVSQAELRAETSQLEARLLPGAFPSNYTQPATRYTSARPIPNSAKPANEEELRLEHAHWPLVIMLAMTQMAGGLHLLLAGALSFGLGAPARALAVAALFSLICGLNVALLHLGRPLKAWRSFLGWRNSWMSREIIVFSVYAGSASLLVLIPERAALAWATSLLALGGIACSAMIYVDTRRPSWPARFVFPWFFGATLLLGATAGAVVCSLLAPDLVPRLAAAGVLVRSALFALDCVKWFHAGRDPRAQLHRSALTEFKFLKPAMIARAALFILATAVSLAAVFSPDWRGVLPASTILAATLASQILERFVFFAASPAPRMPGGIVT